ncbi:glycosyl hydrolase [Nonomuraea sp. KC401]|nr:glycoside hydrolase family 3 C-terminal domain-containing protein [Nonomuraea sp. K271]NBE98253.1 glycosyl hydrolase [Nonomuraea sp. K271]TLF61659.1 glycosyl hydrolase [Nonomuraea sp. KC401]
MLTGADEWSTHADPDIGLRAMVLSDGPSGIRGVTWDERDPAVNLPSATALAATWDVGTARAYGTALAAEARRKGAHVVLGPTINLHRSPLGGRHFEAYSEDPLLTADLAAAYVRGVQSLGVAATPKHYVGNDFETERFTANVVVSERALRELYVAAFEKAVAEAGAWVVMSAYNAVNGATMTENPLLAEPLCDEWGFDGVVVSDWWAARSTVPAALARQDLAMPGPDGPWGDALVAAVRDGRVPEAVVDEKVRRLLRLAARVGALDGVTPAHAPATVTPDGAGPDVGTPGGGAFASGRDAGADLVEAVAISAQDGAVLARRVAADGMVLVRNEGELPWPAPGPRSVAVIGHNALQFRSQGGGSATVTPPYVVSPLDGLRAALPDAEITWSLGAVTQEGLAPLPIGRLTDPVSGEPGVRARFLDSGGRELLSENRRSSDLARLGGSRPAGTSSVEVTTRYQVREPGIARLGVAGAGLATLAVDGQRVLERELVHEGEDFGGGLVSPPHASVTVRLAAGEVVLTARLDGVPQGNGLTLTLGEDLAPDAGPAHGGEAHGGEVEASEMAALEAAVASARRAEVAVIVVGTSPEIEREAADRATLALPGAQDRLVRAVAAANPRTVVVVNAGAPVLMPWRNEVAAVLLGWFGGQEFGNALADVLLGTAEPGGRLPTTWPGEEADVPVLRTAPVDGVVFYDEGVHVGYRAWLRAGAEPAYPFGHGLGYTSWELYDLAAGAGEVSLTVRNTGGRAGKHVVQVYLSREPSAVERPVRWLVGFAVVRAGAGQAERVTIPLARRAFQHWDGGWRTEPGEFTVHAGSSVADLPLTAQVTAP